MVTSKEVDWIFNLFIIIGVLTIAKEAVKANIDVSVNMLWLYILINKIDNVLFIPLYVLMTNLEEDQTYSIMKCIEFALVAALVAGVGSFLFSNILDLYESRGFMRVFILQFIISMMCISVHIKFFDVKIEQLK